MMLKQNRLNAALSINLFLLFPPLAHVLIFGSRFGKSVFSPSLTEQHIVDHLLVCLAVAVGQWRKWVANLYQVRDKAMVHWQQMNKNSQFREHTCPCTWQPQQQCFLVLLLLHVSCLRWPATKWVWKKISNFYQLPALERWNIGYKHVAPLSILGPTPESLWVTIGQRYMENPLKVKCIN